MSNETIVGTLWEPIHDFFEILVQELVSCNGQVWSTIAHHETDVFPFTGYLALGKHGIPGEEDLVLTLDVQSKGRLLLIGSDIARGDGLVLVDGPSAEIRGTPLDASALQEVRDRTLQFFSEQREMVRRELCD